MAQGAIKLKANPVKPSQTRAGIAKKGKRTIAPKRASLVKNQTLLKKHCSGLTAMTERTLGAKAGHLEMLKGGKKNKDKDAATVQKGGSKKFG